MNIRSLLLASLCFLLAYTAQAQTILPFPEAEKQGFDIKKLDEQYEGGLTHKQFKDRTEDYIKAYKQMIQDLGGFLNKNGFTWGKETRCFNRFYFNEQGKIDLYFYNFPPNTIEEEKMKVFDKLMKEFAKSYQFPMLSTEKFSQCSPVRFNDVVPTKK